MNDKIISQIISEIKKAKTIFIAGHSRPDGDTVGASIALALVLKQLNKKVDVYSKYPVPDFLKLTKSVEQIKVGRVPFSKKYDLAIILECSDFERMGNLIKPEQVKKIINIDHHLIHKPFGDINFVVPEASSTCYLVYLLLKKMGIPRQVCDLTPLLQKGENKEIASWLYVGLITDTGKFQQNNTTPETLLVASELLKTGIDIEQINGVVYGNKSLPALKLLGYALRSLAVTPDGKVSYITLKTKDFIDSAADISDVEGIINYAISIKGVEVAILFRETVPHSDNGEVRVSMRSKTFDLTPIAAKFEGGGHKHAAGFSIKGNIDEVKKIILKSLKNSVI